MRTEAPAYNKVSVPSSSYLKEASFPAPNITLLLSAIWRLPVKKSRVGEAPSGVAYLKVKVSEPLMTVSVSLEPEINNTCLSALPVK